MSGLVAFALSLALTPLVAFALGKRGVLDHPNERSSHDRPVVRGGGIAFAIACVVAVVLTEGPIGAIGFGVLVAAGGLGLIGLSEDIWGVAAGPRFALQVLVAAIALVWLLDDLSGNPLWAAVFAMGCLLALSSYANAFNFMDGINGISAVQAIVGGAAWAWLGVVRDVPVLVWAGAVLVGASLGFLPFNFPKARVFLGDSGSYFIGGWQAAIIVAGLRSGVPPEAMGAPLALYLADTGTTLIRRVAAGHVWHQPHREHAYQRLIRKGWSHSRTTALVGIAVALCAAAGALATGELWMRVVGDAALLAVIVAYLLMPRWLEARTAAAV